MRPHIDGLRERGVDAVAIDLPVRKAETAVEAYREAAGLVAPDAPASVIGGQSYGGRVASLLAAAGPPAMRGLVLTELSAPPTGRAGLGRPQRPLAVDRGAGAVAVRGGGPVRAPRPAADGRDRAVAARGAGHLPATRPHPQAGARRCARPDRGVRQLVCEVLIEGQRASDGHDPHDGLWREVRGQPGEIVGWIDARPRTHPLQADGVQRAPMDGHRDTRADQPDRMGSPERIEMVRGARAGAPAPHRDERQARRPDRAPPCRRRGPCRPRSRPSETR